MQVFVTGGTGLIGSAVVAELVAHGHAVSALARSDRSADAIVTAGATAVRGSLSDLDVLRDAASAADGVVHLAFDHDSFGSVEEIAGAAKQESAALAALGDALVGSDRPLVAASGTPAVPGRVTTEHDDTPVFEGPLAERGRATLALLALAGRGVRSAAVRLPRTVHNDGRGGFAGLLTDIARQSAIAGYPGDGTQRWPAVHALDAAVLFRLVLESAPAGTVWHAVDDEGDEVRALAEVIGRRLGLPVQRRPEADFGPLGAIFAMDQPSSSVLTRERLGWQPSHPGLLADLENVLP
ncbi:SDR family oxidoreductase [Jatrophihabitans fulvus]